MVFVPAPECTQLNNLRCTLQEVHTSLQVATMCGRYTGETHLPASYIEEEIDNTITDPILRISTQGRRRLLHNRCIDAGLAEPKYEPLSNRYVFSLPPGGRSE